MAKVIKVNHLPMIQSSTKFTSFVDLDDCSLIKFSENENQMKVEFIDKRSMILLNAIVTKEEYLSILTCLDNQLLDDKNN